MGYQRKELQSREVKIKKIKIKDFFITFPFQSKIGISKVVIYPHFFHCLNAMTRPSSKSGSDSQTSLASTALMLFSNLSQPSSLWQIHRNLSFHPAISSPKHQWEVPNKAL